MDTGSCLEPNSEIPVGSGKLSNAALGVAVNFDPPENFIKQVPTSTFGAVGSAGITVFVKN